MWTQIDPSTIEVDDRDHTGPHNFPARKSWPPWCAKCGLVALRNEVTEKALKMGCGYRRNPIFIAYCKRLWGLK